MYRNKKIFILGMARSGYEVAKVLLNRGNEVTITDAKEQDKNNLEEIKELGAKFVLSQTPAELLDDSFDLVVKNPGITYKHPVVEKAQELGIKVINEMELIYNILPKNVFIIGITGSNGKTTTTTLTYELLKKQERTVHIGGNIGIPFAAMYDEIKENDILVLEVSSHQLHDLYDFNPNIAVLTNITETHLDFFDTYDNYIAHKAKIFQNQSKKDSCVINLDNEVSMNLKGIKSNKTYFSTKEKADIYLENDFIVYKEEKIINIKDIKIKGEHNIQNIMCAIISAKEFNISNEDIKDVLSSFGGVEHRIEYVCKYKNREFYNDSKSTNVVALLTALAAFDSNVVLIMGGLDRGHSFDELETKLNHVNHIIAYGETKHRISDFAKKIGKDVSVVDNLEEAVKASFNLSNEGDKILLSPACASWDQFKDYEERGRAFKKYVMALNK